MSTASFLAVATAATWCPRFLLMRWKNALSGPGAGARAHAASTNIDRA